MSKASFLSAPNEWALPIFQGTKLGIVSADSLIGTWVVLGVLAVDVCVARYYLRQQESLGRFLLISFTKDFMDLITQSCGAFKYVHFSFITALFLFILFCNTAGLLPFIKEPTADINTTFALSITVFLYTLYHGIRVRGVGGYLKEYIEPFFLFLPLHVMGKLSSVASLALRLFGNIMGGAIITDIYLHTASGSWYIALGGIVSWVSIIIAGFFCLFEGFIQAFVFCMLALTAIASDTSTHTKDEEYIP